MNHSVNLAIQLLPLYAGEKTYTIIDKAIETIKATGMKYTVCPFETVVEGPYDQVMKLINDLQEAAFAAGAGEILINMKLQRRKDRDVFIDEKTGKYN